MLQTSSVLFIMSRSSKVVEVELFLATDEVNSYNSICSYVITYCTKIMFDLSHLGDAQIFARLVCTLLQQDDKTAVACMLLLFFFEGVMRAHAAIKYCVYISCHPAICHG